MFVKVDSSTIQHEMELFHQHLVNIDSDLKDSLVSVKKAHITLLVFRVEEEQMETVRSIFKAVVMNKMDKDRFDVMFEGIEVFPNHTAVYMVPRTGVERLVLLNKTLKEAFTIAGFPCEEVFTPHVTLAKQRFWKGRELREFPSEVLKKYEKKHFGIQTIRGIQLLSMTKQDTNASYYACDEEVTFEEKYDNGKERYGMDGNNEEEDECYKEKEYEKEKNHAA